MVSLLLNYFSNFEKYKHLLRFIESVFSFLKLLYWNHRKTNHKKDEEYEYEEKN